MLRAQRHNELLVRLFLARFVEDAHVCLTPVERLAGFSKTASKAIVDERELEDTFESLQNGHLALACGGIGGDFDLLGGSDGLVVFSVRLCGWIVSERLAIVRISV